MSRAAQLNNRKITVAFDLGYAKTSYGGVRGGGKLEKNVACHLRNPKLSLLYPI
jgi:hypothetical protein